MNSELLKGDDLHNELYMSLQQTGFTKNGQPLLKSSVQHTRINFELHPQLLVVHNFPHNLNYDSETGLYFLFLAYYRMSVFFSWIPNIFANSLKLDSLPINVSDWGNTHASWLWDRNEA